MNNMAGFYEKWLAFKEYCRQPKNRWDAKDQTAGLLLVSGVLFFVTFLAVVLTKAN